MCRTFAVPLECATALPVPGLDWRMRIPPLGAPSQWRCWEGRWEAGPGFGWWQSQQASLAALPAGGAFLSWDAGPSLLPKASGCPQPLGRKAELKPRPACWVPRSSSPGPMGLSSHWSSAGGGCWSLQTAHACSKRSRDRLSGGSTGQLCQEAAEISVGAAREPLSAGRSGSPSWLRKPRCP